MPYISPRKDHTTLSQQCRDCGTRYVFSDRHGTYQYLCRICGEAQDARGYELPGVLRKEWEAYRRGRGPNPLP